MGVGWDPAREGKSNGWFQDRKVAWVPSSTALFPLEKGKQIQHLLPTVCTKGNRWRDHLGLTRAVVVVTSGVLDVEMSKVCGPNHQIPCAGVLNGLLNSDGVPCQETLAPGCWGGWGWVPSVAG